MKLVNDYGTIVRMSDREYDRYLHDAANTARNRDLPNPIDYGRAIGTLDLTATDLGPRDFAWAIWHDCKKCRKYSEKGARTRSCEKHEAIMKNTLVGDTGEDESDG